MNIVIHLYLQPVELNNLCYLSIWLSVNVLVPTLTVNRSSTCTCVNLKIHIGIYCRALLDIYQIVNTHSVLYVYVIQPPIRSAFHLFHLNSNIFPLFHFHKIILSICHPLVNNKFNVSVLIGCPVTFNLRVIQLLVQIPFLTNNIINCFLSRNIIRKLRQSDFTSSTKNRRDQNNKF